MPLAISRAVSRAASDESGRASHSNSREHSARRSPSSLHCVGRPAAGALYVLAMVGVVVGVDVLFFRGHFWERLAVNVGIVLLFVAFYFRFLRHA